MENTPEGVAYKLLVHIAFAEGRDFGAPIHSSGNYPSRQWILDTYAECLEATKGDREPDE